MENDAETPVWTGQIGLEPAGQRGVWQYVGIDGLDAIPRGNHVYVISAFGTVLYVGSAVDARRRVLQHIRASGWGSSVAELWKRNADVIDAVTVDVYTFPDDDTGAEARMIRALRPCLNVTFNEYPSPLPEPLRSRERAYEERVTRHLVSVMSDRMW